MPRSKDSPPPGRRRDPGAAQPSPISRVPPHNLAAETAVLGSVLLDAQVMDDLVAVVKPEDFYKQAHATVYEAMIALHDRRDPIDIVTLCEAMRPTGRLELVGGATYVSWLADTVPSAANVLSYAKIVADMASLRRTILALSNVIHRAYSDVDDVRAFLDETERLVMEATSERTSGRATDVKSAIKEALQAYDLAQHIPDGIIGVSTGLRYLDGLLLGMRGGDLVVIAARPSHGKSALAGQIVTNAALQGIPSGIFTLEMSKMQCAQRMLAQQQGINLYFLRKGQLNHEDDLGLIRTADELSRLPIFINDTASITAREIAAQCRRERRRLGGLGLVVVDYLQLVSPGSTKSQYSREQEVSAISRDMKILAKELDIPVVVLSQMNRSIEQRGLNRRPQLSDLRESGAIEQDADTIIFINRDWVHNPLPENKDVGDIILAKNRQGPTGDLKVGWNYKSTLFHDIDYGSLSV